jgi:hypothetical protein
VGDADESIFEPETADDLGRAREQRDDALAANIADRLVSLVGGT